jgi:catechol 2,3-dioxygenase-like lactoylglutathione lyase family enzyme
MLSDSQAFSGFSVNDLAAAKTFYEDTLGLNVSQDNMGMQLHLNDDLEIFIYAKPDHVPAAFTILNFTVKNIDETVTAMAAASVEFEHYDNLPAQQDDKQILRGLSAGYGPDIAWFKDPAGNILSVIQNA